jgi:hypothetical protein
MSTSKDKQTPVVKYGGQPSEAARFSLEVHQRAVDKALDRKRRLGQYRVEWDGEKAVEIRPEDAAKTAAE